MTEKQGGSDVRANRTTATPTGSDGEYRLTGHKWFCSAPMCDVFLVLAQAAGRADLLPRAAGAARRRRATPFALQRLKDKLGNRSNASSEVEFDGTVGCAARRRGRAASARSSRWSPRPGSTACSARPRCMRAALVAGVVAHARTARPSAACSIDQPLMTERAGRPRHRVRGRDRAGDAARRRRRRPDDEHESAFRRLGAAAGEVLDLQADAVAWSPRRWSASAATGTSRSPGCRGCSASRR